MRTVPPPVEIESQSDKNKKEERREDSAYDQCWGWTWGGWRRVVAGRGGLCGCRYLSAGERGR